jgi:hypothetical protein
MRVKELGWFCWKMRRLTATRQALYYRYVDAF